MNNFEVTIMNKDTSSILEALGITEERSIELSSKMSESFKNNNTYTNVISETSKLAKNANEIAFISFHLGRFCGQQSQNPFSGFLHSLTSNVD